ncbi:pilus assembly protein PilM [Clostridium beijerinckii]|uniref:Competence protein A n=1 Tax=Clostridium beijerinckii TaxID=1520 RepID=A0A1S8S021_CLOBE|nr:type IV pilus assembly protein PilM [Clostridium beijerinckii]OOM58787.1 competence protein A [Clostridium beijerinckii]
MKIRRSRYNPEDKLGDDTKGEGPKSIDFKMLMNMDLVTLKNMFSNKVNKLNLPKKKRRVVALDLGSSAIKIVEGMYYKSDLTIFKYIIIPTPKGAIIDGEIKKEDELKNKLSQVLKENGIKTKDAICTTNSSLIINREISIPKVEEEEMDTVIRYEIQQYLPINLEDYILQGTILNKEKTDKNKKIDVRVIAYPEKLAKGYYNFLLKLNLKPYALDVNYNAINKFINYVGINNEFKHKLNDAIAFIDLGESSIDVNIYKNGQLDFTRIIKDCGNEIDEMLIERNYTNSNEIGSFKIKSLDLDEEFEPINILTRQIVDEWIEKIEKIIQFYKNRNMGNELNNIIIFGGSSKIKGMEQYMTRKLGVNTKIKGVPKVSFKSKDDGKPIDDFMNVIGAVIRNV